MAETVSRINELEARIDTLYERNIELEARVLELESYVTAPVQQDAGAYLAAKVDAARSADPAKARAIYVALAAEMHNALSDRALVTHVQRIAATYDPDGAIWGGNPSTSVKLARYLSEHIEGSNGYGATVTRRLHKALELLGVSLAKAA